VVLNKSKKILITEDFDFFETRWNAEGNKMERRGRRIDACLKRQLRQGFTLIF